MFCCDSLLPLTILLYHPSSSLSVPSSIHPLPFSSSPFHPFFPHPSFSPPSLTSFSSSSGYSTPILHGLCSFGHATRHILQQYCDNKSEMIKCIKARFSKPVIPGDTLQTDMWREGNKVFFNCKVRWCHQYNYYVNELSTMYSGTSLLWTPLRQA